MQTNLMKSQQKVFGTNRLLKTILNGTEKPWKYQGKDLNSMQANIAHLWMKNCQM